MLELPTIDHTHYLPSCNHKQTYTDGLQLHTILILVLEHYWVRLRVPLTLPPLGISLWHWSVTDTTTWLPLLFKHTMVQALVEPPMEKYLKWYLGCWRLTWHLQSTVYHLTSKYTQALNFQYQSFAPSGKFCLSYV